MLSGQFTRTRAGRQRGSAPALCAVGCAVAQTVIHGHRPLAPGIRLSTPLRHLFANPLDTPSVPANIHEVVALRLVALTA